MVATQLTEYTQEKQSTNTVTRYESSKNKNHTKELRKISNSIYQAERQKARRSETDVYTSKAQTYGGSKERVGNSTDHMGFLSNRRMSNEAS